MPNALIKPAAAGNQPPHQAHSVLPRLPPLLDRIDPDGWLRAVHRRRFKRRVQSNGSVQIGSHRYYVGKWFKGRYLLLQIDAHAQTLVALAADQVVKTARTESARRDDNADQGFAVSQAGTIR